MRNPRKVYADICRGYSLGEWRKKPVYIKHLTSFEYGEAEDYQNAELERAKSQGIPTREQRGAWLAKNELWSAQQDAELKSRESYIANMRLTRSKLAYESQAEAMTKQINEEQARYNDDVAKRERLYDLTAERVSWNKAQFYYIYLSLYKDNSLTKRLVTLRDIAEWDDEESVEILDYYYTFIESFSVENIRRISLSPFFLGHFNLCGDDLAAFYRKPLWELTVYQSNLLASGAHFRNLLRNEAFIPPDIRDDPTKIEEFVSRSEAQKELMAKASRDGASVGLFGTKRDIQAMGGVVDHSFMKDGPQSLVSKL